MSDETNLNDDVITDTVVDESGQPIAEENTHQLSEKTVKNWANAAVHKFKKTEYEPLKKKFEEVTAKYDELLGENKKTKETEAEKAFKAELEKLKAERETERQAAQTESDNTALVTMMTELGVRAPKMLLNHLKAEGVVARNDDGDLVWRTDKYGMDDVPVKDGLKRFLQTDEGKLLLPSTGAAGSGAKPNQKATTAPQNQQDRYAAARERLMKAWTNE